MNFIGLNLAWISLATLFLVILISSFSRINVGVLAIGFSWIVGHYLAGMPIGQVVAGFPTSLFLLLLGVTLFFSQIKLNGTLDRMASLAIGLARGRRGLVPIIIFFLTALFAAAGPGNIGATALLAPLAMEIASHMKISAFLMSIMVVAGANAGTFTPLAPTGLIAADLISGAGLSMHPWKQIFLPSFLAQGFIAFASYAMFGGIGLLRDETSAENSIAVPVDFETPLSRDHWLSFLAIAALVSGVTIFHFDIGFLAFFLSAALAIISSADIKKITAHVPWDAIVMVCGVSALISVLESVGGIELFTEILAKASNATNVMGVIAFVTGLLSAFSSSSGVIMPAFIPTVPGLAAKLGADPVAIVSSINVGSHVVDISPLSTLGALCLASAGKHEDPRRLFRNLMIYGLSLSFFGALVCYLFFGILKG